MYKQDKIGIDVRIDGMTGELSYDIAHMRTLVKVLEDAYKDAHEAAVKAMRASADAYCELDRAKRELEVLESIDETLRRSKKEIDSAYDVWAEWRKS